MPPGVAFSIKEFNDFLFIQLRCEAIFAGRHCFLRETFLAPFNFKLTSTLNIWRLWYIWLISLKLHYPIIKFVINSRGNKSKLKLGKISSVESLSKVTYSSTLENPQFGKLSGCCYGYCDKLCDWWIKLSALNMIG